MANEKTLRRTLVNTLKSFSKKIALRSIDFFDNLAVGIVAVIITCIVFFAPYLFGYMISRCFVSGAVADNSLFIISSIFAPTSDVNECIGILAFFSTFIIYLVLPIIRKVIKFFRKLWVKRSCKSKSL